MNVLLSLLNGAAVSLFGSILAASFCNILDTPRRRRIFWCCAVLLPLLQGLILFLSDEGTVQRFYPLIAHLPLLIVFRILSGRYIWPLVSILAAYLCCQLRRWLALAAAALFSGGAVLQDAVELILTIPLLFLLLRFVSPAVRQMSSYPLKLQFHFGAVPLLYYVFDYMTRVYTALLSSGSPVAVEFMSFVCCGAYLVFLIYISAEERAHYRMQETQRVLDLQLSQAVREIGALRESQSLVRRFRHDLRHHLQYLSVCIENGQTEQAQNYISGICAEMEMQKVQRFCENEAANLILSSFAARAEKEKISLQIHGTLPANIPISDSDLCVLLSNSLENAVHACVPLTAEGRACTIDVQIYYRGNHLFLQIKNPCADGIRFENGIPVTDRPGHGIGVQSICAITERYGGVYAFLVQDGTFILRLSL